MNNNLLSIIIVTFNNEEYITECLNSLQNIHINNEIIVIDNNSTDHTLYKVRKFKKELSNYNITLIKNKTNRGFAQAVNQGLVRSKGNFICLLGSDCSILKNSMESLTQYLNNNPETGIVAPRLINKQGETLLSCRRLPTIGDVILELTGFPKLFPKRIKPRWKNIHLDHNTPTAVEQPEASCIMTHRRALNHIGLMDERFTIFFNDVDWCRRFLENGYTIIFVPQAKVIHHKGGSIYKNRIPMIWKSHQGFYKYFMKYSQNNSQKLFMQIIGFVLIFTAVLRSILYIISEPFFKKSRNLK